MIKSLKVNFPPPPLDVDVKKSAGLLTLWFIEGLHRLATYFQTIRWKMKRKQWRRCHFAIGFIRSRPTKINNFNHFENMNSLPPLQSNWVENGPEIFEEFVISTPGSIDSNPFNSPIHSFRLYFGQKSSKLVKNGPVLSLFHLVKPNRFWKDQSVEPISTNWTHFVVGLNKSDQLKCAGSSNNGSTLLSKAISNSILQNAFIYWPER